MSRLDRRFVAPAVIGVSAAAALAQFMPELAFAASRQAPQPAPNAAAGAKAGAALNPSPDVASTATPMGCTESSSPSYGCGKITVEAVPVASTFPAEALPDVTGLTFDVAGSIAEDDTVYPGATNTCKTGDTNSASSDQCPESLEGSVTTPSAETGTWVAGDQYDVSLDTTATSAPAPDNSLIPPITGTFPDCTAYMWTSDPTGPSGCSDLTPVMVYGTYHQVGLHVVNPVTHKAVAKAAYELCSATISAPTSTSKGCPTGSDVVASATTTSQGKLVFPGLFLGSQNYSIALTSEPRGYHKTPSRRLGIPVVTIVAEAGTLIQGTTKLAPIKTTVKTHDITTTKNTPVTFNALAGAKHVVGPLTLIKLSKAHHGSAHHSSGRITYRPHDGFVGKDVFTYTVRNGVGVVVTGKVIVNVKA